MTVSVEARPATRRAPAPTWLLKLVMATTGVVWALFALVHLFGNLKVYMGAESFDGYARWLREVLYPLVPHEGVLWALRVVLLACLVAHVTCAFWLAARSRHARGRHRARRRGLRMWAAAAMLPTGLVLLAFLLLHVADLTLGLPPFGPPGFAPVTDGGSPHANLIASFQRPWMATAYALAMLALAAHLFHGTVLAAQDFGATGARTRQVFAWLGGLLAVAVLLGNAGIPLMVQIGVLS